MPQEQPGRGDPIGPLDWLQNIPFEAATGLPPHQYVIARRVERAKQILQGGDLSLAEVAAGAGFSDQSQFSHHFKRLVGVTPARCQKPARTA